MTYVCDRCGWRHIDAHSGYVCPCVPCDRCTTGDEPPPGPCEVCEGTGWRIVPIAERVQSTPAAAKRPFREPRYDDVYAEGVAWLDSLARADDD